MKFLVDSANVELIKEIYAFYPCDGVTTNPSILSKGTCQPFEALRNIRALIGADAELHAQVISEKAEDMVAEGHRIVSELGANTYVKIPTTVEGLKAMRALSSEGIGVTATTVYSPMQAYLAAKAGASYVAPYVNRIDNLGYDGIETTKRIQRILTQGGFSTQILAASFKNSQQVLALCEYGIGAATVSPDVIANLIKDANVSLALDAFQKDFASLCGDGKTMLNCD